MSKVPFLNRLGPSYSLLVIDAQPIFSAANSTSLIRSIRSEILTAKQAKAPIVFVEFALKHIAPQVGQTHQTLLDAAAGSDFSIVAKKSQSGATEVNQHYRRYFAKLPPLRVCGVNTEMCVLDTVEGLKKLGWENITIASSACNSDANHQFGLNLLKKIPGVYLA